MTIIIARSALRSVNAVMMLILPTYRHALTQARHMMPRDADSYADAAERRQRRSRRCCRYKRQLRDSTANNGRYTQ